MVVELAGGCCNGFLLVAFSLLCEMQERCSRWLRAAKVETAMATAPRCKCSVKMRWFKRWWPRCCCRTAMVLVSLIFHRRCCTNARWLGFNAAMARVDAEHCCVSFLLLLRCCRFNLVRHWKQFCGGVSNRCRGDERWFALPWWHSGARGGRKLCCRQGWRLPW